MSAPPPSPPGYPTIAVAYTVTESQVITSLVLAALCGVGTLLLYGIIRGWMGVYAKRMDIADLTCRPKRLKLTGFPRFWNFFLPVFTVTEEELLRTAGLDAMLLLRTMAMGIQLFLPLSILGCAVLLPVNLAGHAVNDAVETGTSNGDSLSYLSIANLPPRSPLLWIPTVFIFLFSFYTVWLISVHHRSISILRLQYLMDVQPLREPGDHGAMALIGPNKFETLDKEARSRMLLTLHELFNPIAMYSWPVRAWTRHKASGYWAAAFGMRSREMQEVANLGPGATAAAAAVSLQQQRSLRSAPGPVTVGPNDVAPLLGAAAGGGGSSRIGSGSAPAAMPYVGRKVLGITQELTPDVLYPEEGSFERHRQTWEAFSPLNAVTGGKPLGMFPWWLDQHEQPAELVDDANVVLLGKTVVRRRQLLPAVSGRAGMDADIKVNAFQYAVLIQAATDINDHRHTMELSSMPPAHGGKGSALAGCCGYYNEAFEDGQDAEAAWGKYAAPPLGGGGKGAVNGVGHRAWEQRQAEDILQTLQGLFPTTFRALVPVFNHEKVDQLLMQLDGVMNQINQEAELQEVTKKTDAKQQDDKQGAGERSGVMQKLLQECKEVEDQVLAARKEALDAPPGHAYFALFSCQRDALALSRCSIGCRGWDALWRYRTKLAPAPEDVNWQTLWTSHGSRQLRRLLYILPLMCAMLFPMGLIAGTLTNLDLAVCSGSPETNKLYWSWYCTAEGFWVKIAKDLLTGLVPMVLNTFWDTYVMPIIFYFIAQGERSCVSLSELDRLVTHYFYLYDVINAFLFVVLSGSFFSQIGGWLHGSKGSQSLLVSISQGLIGSCNYFFNSMIWKTFFTNVFRFIWPHDGTVLFVFFRLAGLHCPKGPRDRMVIRMNPSFRGGRHYGALFLVYIWGLTYAVINPSILPLCLGFFCTAWLAWKYCILYFYERSHESGGQMFDEVVKALLATLHVTSFFTGICLISRQAWVCGGLVLGLLPFMLGAVHRLRAFQDFDPDQNYPIEAVMKAPVAVINPLQYVPPGLRNGAVGWYPEQQKVWEKYGIPRYA